MELDYKAILSGHPKWHKDNTTLPTKQKNKLQIHENITLCSLVQAAVEECVRDKLS